MTIYEVMVNNGDTLLVKTSSNPTIQIVEKTLKEKNLLLDGEKVIRLHATGLKDSFYHSIISMD